MASDGPCGTCGQRHVRNVRIPSGEVRELPTCSGHVTTDRATYVKGQDRKKLDQPRPCGQARPAGQPDWKCHMHGAAAPQVKAKAAQAKAEAKATVAVLRRLGASGDPVTDPISKLCAIAGRAVAFMESLGMRVDQLDGETDRDQARAEIAVYGRSIKDAAGVVESIIRMGIAERLAKQDAERTTSIVAFFDAVLTDLGHNPRDPHVAGIVAQHLARVA